MKKVYLIHGWGGKEYTPWFDSLEKSLQEKGIEVHSFDMPESDEPKIETWVGYLQEHISFEDLDEHTFFVGHSVGCQTILRFLEKLPKHKRIGGCVFVGGWFTVINLDPEELAIAHPWENTPLHFERVLDHCDRFFAIFSDNDQYVHLDQKELFEKNLGAKTLIKKQQRHFEAVKDIPEVLTFLT